MAASNTAPRRSSLERAAKTGRMLMATPGHGRVRDITISPWLEPLIFDCPPENSTRIRQPHVGRVGRPHSTETSLRETDILILKHAIRGQVSPAILARSVHPLRHPRRAIGIVRR